MVNEKNVKNKKVNKNVKKRENGNKGMDEDNVLGMLAHLLSIFAGFLGPLIIYLVAEDNKVFAKQNAKNALNFTLSVLLYTLASVVLSFTIVLLVVTIPAIIFLNIFALVMQIVASVKAHNGEVYEYPLAIPFLR